MNTHEELSSSWNYFHPRQRTKIENSHYAGEKSRADKPGFLYRCHQRGKFSYIECRDKTLRLFEESATQHQQKYKAGIYYRDTKSMKPVIIKFKMTNCVIFFKNRTYSMFVEDQPERRSIEPPPHI